MKTADLHIHTKASGDALNEPEAVFQQAEQLGLAAISFTDHDSTGALEIGQQLARNYPVKFMAGIEISASWNGEYAHILAYFGDEPDENLKNFISASARSGARAMALPIIKKMREMGYDISPEEYEALAAECKPGDSPLFRLTVKKGFARDIADYQRLFGNLWQEDAVIAFPDTRLVIDAVHNADGIAVIAHPGGSAKNRLFAFDIRNLEILIENGIDGIEVYHELNDERNRVLYKEVAESHRLLITGGSDSHGLDGIRQIGSYTCDWEMFASGFAEKIEKKSSKII